MLEVEFLSDRIALINKGKILVEGKPDDLKKNIMREILKKYS